jgi:NitT/TauT family transport system substrate-binding protein
MRIKFLLVIALAVVVGAKSAFEARAQTPSVKVGLPSLSMFSIMNHIAQDQGFFEKEGVQVELSHFESGSLNIRALLARAVDVADVETGLILGAAANGADLRIIGTQAQGLHFALYARKDISNLQGLAGRTFAISGIGGLPHLVLLALLDRQELDPNKVQMLTVGGTSARLAALMAGKVDATLGEYSPKVEADSNLRRLMIVSQELPLYMAQGLAVWGDTLSGKRDALERWQRGLVKATRWAYENKAEFIKASQKHLPSSTEELSTVYDFYLQARVWAINGELEPKRVAYMQDLGIKTKTQSKPVDLDKLVALDNANRIIAALGRRDYPAAR